MKISVRDTGTGQFSQSVTKKRLCLIAVAR